MLFPDRQHAGTLLAPKLERFRAARPIVFGLTRGGVPVAFEVARFLGAPLEPVVRKVGAQRDPEYAIGAIAEGRCARRGGCHARVEEDLLCRGLLR